MYRRYVPLLLMLSAGAATWIITMVRKVPMLEQLITLAVVLLLFYLLGSVIKWTLDFFDRENEKRASEEGEVFAKLVDDTKGDTN